jgi:Mor family transcriptional regulator
MTKVLLKFLDILPSSSKGYFEIYLPDGRKVVLDSISYKIWSLCDGSRTYEDIVEYFGKDIDKRVVIDVLKNLIKIGLVQEVDVT